MTREEAERKAQIIDFQGGYTIELVTKIYDDFESKSCDGCKYDEKDDSYPPAICWECSRYYADKFELKDKQ